MPRKNRFHLSFHFLLLIFSAAAASGWAEEPSGPIGLRCDFRDTPLAVENRTPPFSWRFDDDRIGAAQTAYRIQVASGKDFGELKWDSGRVESRRSHLVRYEGEPLRSKGRYFWRVRYWDQNDNESPWSEPARFEMGVLEPGEWAARWIQPVEWERNEGPEIRRWAEMAIFAPEAVYEARKDHWDRVARGTLMNHWDRLILSRVLDLNRVPYFRREFELDRPVESARLRYSAIGFVEVRLNGEPVSGDLLDPAVSQYSVAVNYVTHDVTGLLGPGRNALGFILDDGWARETVAWPFPEFRDNYNTPALRAELEIEYADGTVEIFVTDESWKQGRGGLLASNHYIGEFFDANLEPEGWDAPGFDDSDWRPVASFETPVGDPVIQAQSVQPQREIKRFTPIAVTEPQPGVWVFELPETITGNVEIKLPAGQTGTVYVRPSEWLWNEEITTQNWHHNLRYPDGSIREASPGMIVAKHRSSAVMSDAPPVFRRGAIGITTWAVKPDGRNPLTYQTRFSPQVMRYLEVTGLEFTPDLDTVTGILIHNDLPVNHDAFDSSDELLNRIFKASASSTLQNTQSMSWDNATERNQTTWPWTWPAAFNTAIGDFAMVYRKFLRDQELWFLPNGRTSGQTLTLRAYSYRDVIPVMPIHETPVVDLPWLYLTYYGDIDTVRDYFPKIRKWIDFYWEGEKGERYLEGIRSWETSQYGQRWRPDPDVPSTNTGDHVQLEPTSQMESDSFSDPLFVTVGRWLNVLSKAAWIAGQLGEIEERRYYEDLAAAIVDAVRESAMRDPETGAYGARRVKSDPVRFVTAGGNPVSNAIAVEEGIARPDERQELADLTFDEIETYYEGAIPGGREWYRALYLISQYGYMDEAVEKLRSTDFPAIGFFIEKLGLTTISESRSFPTGGILPNSSAQAESHAFANWFVELLCGIRFDPASAGMQDFMIAPLIPSNLAFASLSMESPYGEIRSGWKQDDDEGRTIMEIRIPPNSTAAVVAPTGRPLQINGRGIDEFAGVVLLKSEEEGTQRFRLPAGEFRISWENRKSD